MKNLFEGCCLNWVGDLVQKQIHEDDTVLDLGCGIMQATLDTCPAYPRTRLRCSYIVGVDIYRGYLHVLKHKNRILVLRADLRNPLPFQDKTFDVVLLLDTLEHLNYPSMLHLLAESERVATRKVIVLTPVNFNLNYIHATTDVYPYCGLGVNPYQQHRCLVTSECLESHGFKVRFIRPGNKRWYIFNPFTYIFAVKVIA